jgi:hypothetical protein
MSKSITKTHQVYRNLRNGKWSVQTRNGTKLKVVLHSDNVYMGLCEFVVQQKGNARVRLEQRKCVHAFVRGIFLDAPSVVKSVADDSPWVEVTYNPYKYTSFVRKDTKEPVRAAAVVVLKADGSVWATCPT